MLPANPLIPWPDPFKIFLPASLTHGFHTSFLGVFYLESTITFSLLPAYSPVSFIVSQFGAYPLFTIAIDKNRPDNIDCFGDHTPLVQESFLY